MEDVRWKLLPLMAALLGGGLLVALIAILISVLGQTPWLWMVLAILLIPLMYFACRGLLKASTRDHDATADPASTNDMSLMNLTLGSAGLDAISSAEMSYSIDHVAAQLTEQVVMISQIAHSSETMSQTVEAVEQQAHEALHGSTAARQESMAGQSALGGAIAQMETVNASTNASLERIEILNSRVNSIKEVASVIDGIAAQTNLLALNAAIEAARAGEHGRGFAVVADEVRQLAARTSGSTTEVATIVNEVLEEAGEFVAQIRKLSAEIEATTTQMSAVGAQLEGIAGSVDTVQGRIEGMAAGTTSNREHLQSIAGAISKFEVDLKSAEQETQGLAAQAQKLMDLAEQNNAILAEFDPSSYHKPLYELARAAADAIQQAFADAVSQGKVTSADLFDREYQAITGTKPQKYNTRFDALCDQILPAIQEPVLGRHPAILYCIATDQNGFVPTHNNRYAQAPTGNYEIDLVNSRSKRLFNDRTGARCGAHTKKMLLQTYKRDTGEVLHDVSVPIYLDGRHWGGLRIGYKPENSKA